VTYLLAFSGIIDCAVKTLGLFFQCELNANPVPTLY
jgi:hypothetical protein